MITGAGAGTTMTSFCAGLSSQAITEKITTSGKKLITFFILFFLIN
jgi:hypothetical protein